MLHTQESPSPCAYPPHMHMENRQVHMDTCTKTRKHVCTAMHRHTHRHTPDHSLPPPAGTWLPAKCSAFCWVCTTFHRL